MRAKEPFTIFKRKTASGTSWAYRVYDEAGTRRQFAVGLPGTTSRTAVKAYLMGKYREGTLIPEAKEVRAAKAVTFGEFASGFFTKDSDFSRRRAATDRGAYSGNYLAAGDAAVREHFMPRWGRRKLSAITSGEIEAWVLESLEAQNEDGSLRWSSKTVRNYLGSLSTIFTEAVRLGLIPGNPCAGVVRPRKAPRIKKDSLRPHELAALFRESALETVWGATEGNHHGLARDAFFVLVATGCRIGEIRGLTGAAVHEGSIEVRASWSRLDGMKTTKSGRPRTVPIASKVQAVLGKLKALRGEGLLFTLDGITPVSERWLTKIWKAALENIGISPEEQKARALSPHATRVTYNTLQLAAGTAPEKLRAVVGHTSAELTERYTSFSTADLEDIRDVTEKMFQESE